MQIRNLIAKKVQIALQDIVDNAEIFEQTFIELRYNKGGEDNEKILGFDALNITVSRKRGDAFSSPSGYNFTKDGCVYFYPDKQNRRWGYAVDTPKNRLILAATFKNSILTIMDKDIRNEVIAICKEKGFPTDQVVEDHSFDDYLSKGKRNKKEIEQTQTIEELQAENAKLKSVKTPDISEREAELDRREKDLKEKELEQREEALKAKEAALETPETTEEKPVVPEVPEQKTEAPVVKKTLRPAKKTK